MFLNTSRIYDSKVLFLQLGLRISRQRVTFLEADIVYLPGVNDSICTVRCQIDWNILENMFWLIFYCTWADSLIAIEIATAFKVDSTNEQFV